MKRPQLDEPSDSVNGGTSSGKDSKGRFVKGNKLSQGNVAARKGAAFRAMLFEAVSTEDFQSVVKRVVRDARSGESWACKLLFSYLIGEPQPVDVLERIATLEEQLDIPRVNGFGAAVRR